MLGEREEIITAIKRHKIIVIARGMRREKAIATAEALYGGGIRLMEITFSQGDSHTVEETCATIRLLSKHFKNQMLIGAGTVLSVEQVYAAATAGAKYIISPNTDEKVIQRTKELGLVSIPGAFTPSEAVLAYDYGGDFVKLFPAELIGAGGIKAMRAPLPHIPIIAVGGVNESNIGTFMETGICGVGIGSNIVKKNLVEEGNYQEIKKLAQIYCRAVAQQ